MNRKELKCYSKTNGFGKKSGRKEHISLPILATTTTAATNKIFSGFCTVVMADTSTAHARKAASTCIGQKARESDAMTSLLRRIMSNNGRSNHCACSDSYKHGIRGGKIGTHT